MKCPICGRDNIVLWEKSLKTIRLYRCYDCGEIFEERDIKDCGKQTFHYGDNFPNFKQKREQYKDLGLVPKRTNDNMADLWIDCWEFLKDKAKEGKK